MQQQKGVAVQAQSRSKTERKYARNFILVNLLVSIDTNIISHLSRKRSLHVQTPFFKNRDSLSIR